MFYIEREVLPVLQRSVVFRRLLPALLCVLMLCQPALAAGVTYMPGVTAEMSDPAYWAARQEDSREVILTQEEIQTVNEGVIAKEGTMVMDLKTAPETFNGPRQVEAVRSSSTADAQYYYGWTYGPDGEKADWNYYQAMIDNCADPNATGDMPVRYGVAVERTFLRVFPSDNPILDVPGDLDFDYQALSAVCVNDPVLIYLTSADGKYYMARSRDCSGWIPAKDVAVCADKEEWLAAWDLPSERLLVVYGNKAYTDSSNAYPQTARRMLTQGTALELAEDLEPDQLVGGRSPYHNYVVWLPVRRDDGGYEKQLALIPETAKVSVGYLPLTPENIARVSLACLGDVYGWGGMLEGEDCSGMVRTVYSCFGLHIGRNGNWQWPADMEKIDMTNMSMEEKRLILDGLPLGAALCFPGHEMIYLGKVDGNYYVVSTVGSIMSPDTGRLLNTRDVMINTLDVKRASGLTWLGALNKAFMPCYAKLEGRTYDFPSLQWYHDGVTWSMANKVLPALDIDGTFGVGQTVSREELAQALWDLAGQPAAGAPCAFADVPESHPAWNAISWTAETGIMAGYDAVTFGPEDALTREQAVTALRRFARYQGLPAEAGAELGGFPDAGVVSDYAREAMGWACGQGLITGSGGYLLPTGSLTREQLATVLWRYDQFSAE